MLKYRLQDLPPRLREQAERQLAPKSHDNPLAHIKPIPTPILVSHTPNTISRPPLKDSRGTPNKTESRYNKEVLGGKGRYEPLTFHLPGGNYTPDYLTIDDGIPTFHEVKGGYRFGSESRAVLGFKTAASMYPFFRFVWAVLEKGGKWNVKRVSNPISLQTQIEQTNSDTTSPTTTPALKQPNPNKRNQFLEGDM